jgi:hypothetical protein
MPPKPRPAALAAIVVAALAPSSVLAEIIIEYPWARATVPGATMAAGYLTIRNTGTESRSLLRLTSPVTDTVTLHRSSIDAQGMARMWPVAKLELGPGDTVKFEPNGLHLMFRDLKVPFRVGETVPVTFRFDHGEDPVTVQLEIRPLVDAAPSASSGHEHHRHQHP